jgi:hypothetical protein
MKRRRGAANENSIRDDPLKVGCRGEYLSE